MAAIPAVLPWFAEVGAFSLMINPVGLLVGGAVGVAAVGGYAIFRAIQEKKVKDEEELQRIAYLQRLLVECLATKNELLRQLDECSKAKPKLKVELELKAKLILELELEIELQLEIEIKIRQELEECTVTKDKLKRELEECMEEKVKLKLKLEACKAKNGGLQRQLEDKRKAVRVLEEANGAATKAYNAEKAKMMKELEEFKSKKLGK